MNAAVFTRTQTDEASLIGRSLKPDSEKSYEAQTLRERKGREASLLKDGEFALLSALLLVVSFPDFNLWPLAWVALVPLLILIARWPRPRRAFLSGWLMGGCFFYGTCYWLCYSMVHYGGISKLLAYPLLVPAALIVALFPAVFALTLAQLIRPWGLKALFVSPLLWVSLEWARLSITGQLWNAIGYSQAYHPALIQPARWGGVYAVGFTIVTVNAAISFAILKRSAKATAIAAVVTGCVVVMMLASNAIPGSSESRITPDRIDAVVVALQPNVPMELVKSPAETQELVTRHVLMSKEALNELNSDAVPHLVIWPESPMNFSYGTGAEFRDLVERFAQENHTSILFNSQEPAPNDGWYNSALLVNEEGRLIARYDKIRLMPFGEYVPLPRWLPGSDNVRAIVGEFTPGNRYTLMPVGGKQAGVFVCIESAYPWIARTFTAEGADVLINISNDGYLGPTAVMRQHLANAIFRAVENGRPLLRVTNTGITAYIAPNGVVKDATAGFQTAKRLWTISDAAAGLTFYTRHGDLFVGLCVPISLLMVALSFDPIGKLRHNRPV
jgi:apolipoprotein N-acyltransferase